MKAKTVLGWALVVLIVFFVVSNPAHAASTVGGILHWLRGCGEAIISFVSNVFGSK